MSELQWLVENLEQTEGAVAYLERAMRENPQDEILRINAESVIKRRDDLVRKLNNNLSVSHGELVRYRMKTTGDRYPAKAVGQSIAAFQELVTAVFDAVHTKQTKQRYRPTSESVELSTFEFAGAGAGSVIISLSAPNDRILFGDTDLDQTLNLVERTLSARESDDLKQLAEVVGVSAITKAYAWADVSAGNGIETTIRWGREYEPSKDIVITVDDATIIRGLIENKSDEEQIDHTFDGILHGFDGDTGYFHFETFVDRLDLKGDIDGGLAKTWTTGKVYKALVRRTASLQYATGIEKVGWTLLRLTPSSPDIDTEHST